jgi:hypothetical protein
VLRRVTRGGGHEGTVFGAGLSYDDAACQWEKDAIIELRGTNTVFLLGECAIPGRQGLKNDLSSPILSFSTKQNLPRMLQLSLLVSYIATSNTWLIAIHLM